MLSAPWQQIWVHINCSLDENERGCHERVTLVLEHSEHQRVICVEFKMVNFLLVQQSGNAKLACFLCVCGSKNKKNQWVKRSDFIETKQFLGKGYH